MATDCYKFWEMFLTAPATIASVTGIIAYFSATTACKLQIKRDTEKQHIENAYSFNRTTYELKRAYYLKFYDFLRNSNRDPQANLFDMVVELGRLQIIASEKILMVAEEAFANLPGGEIFTDLLLGKITEDEAQARLEAMRLETQKEAHPWNLKFGQAFSKLAPALREDLQDTQQVFCTKA